MTGTLDDGGMENLRSTIRGTWKLVVDSVRRGHGRILKLRHINLRLLLLQLVAVVLLVRIHEFAK